MADTFQIGDVVQLKSGGPKMTVTSTDTYEYVHTSWFTGTKHETGRFPSGALVTPRERSKSKSK